MSIVKSRIVFIILYTLGLGLLFGLSVWQIQRGLDKQSVLELQADQQSLSLAAQPKDWTSYVYQDTQLSGNWLPNHSLLLENRVSNGQVGFEVLTLFELERDHSRVLVNRGWVAAAETGLVQNLPKPDAGRTSIRGVIYSPDKGVTFGDAILPEAMQSKVWPKKSLYIDLPMFEQAFASKMAPVILVLDEQAPAAFRKIWKAVVILPSKHFAYAVQWFGLGLAFLVYGFIWFRRRQK